MTKILDVCCGSKMFWFDRNHKDVTFCDIRSENHILCDGRKLEIAPDVIADFRDLPFEDRSFSLVVFDPPHMISLGEKSWMAKKYGMLSKQTWREDLKQGFAECFRVLKTDGVLIFKWSESQILLKDILKLTDQEPLFGHPSGKAQKTHWVTFMKK